MTEYENAHQGCAIRRRSDRVVACVSGKDRAKFLHGMLTCDVKGLQPFKWTRACMVSNKGKLLAEFNLYNRGEDIVIEIDRTLKDSTLATLKKYKVIEDVQFSEMPEMEVVMLLGPKSAELLSDVPAPFELKLLPNGFVAGGSSPVTPTYQVIGAKFDAGKAQPLSDSVWETLRIEAGIPIYGVDITEDHLPLESDYLEKGISYTKGCYIGQETIIRVAHRGGHVAHKLMGVVLEQPPSATLVGVAVMKGDKEVGIITSEAFSPKLGKHLGMGMIHRDAFEVGTEVVVTSNAKIVALPLT